MAKATIEHVNITVSNPEASAEMLCALFDWKIRWDGPAQMGGRTIHVGSDDFYIAVYQPEDVGDAAFAYNKGEPLNHIGFQVEDLDEIERRAIAFGLTPFSHGDYHPGRRFYLFDQDGIEYEIVSYAESA
jgi:catechol 2,3-dioxygenase-like lactoylglutathione lyase family enzyme